MTEPAKPQEVVVYHENLPKALSIQRRKFLIAIKKAPDENFCAADEKIVENVMKTLNSPPESCQWDNSEMSKIVNNIVQKNAAFHLPKYLDCAKIVFLVYSGSNLPTSLPFTYSHALEYVLTHARQFGDPSKTIFPIEGHNRFNQVSAQTLVLCRWPLPKSQFMDKVSRLINTLSKTYIETMFRTLNANTTYIALLILRRNVKNEAEFSKAFNRPQTHENYRNLCPWPLSGRLPDCDTSKINGSFVKEGAIVAVAAAYLTNDAQTKRALRATCVQYMEWKGLHLPHLFFKVVELYKIGADDLWDCLIFEGTAAVSLMYLAKVYYNTHKRMKEHPLSTQNWFPYCRMLGESYHRNLSAVENKRICIILAYLVDLKIGFDKSTVRHAQWATSEPCREECERTAQELFEIINNM